MQTRNIMIVGVGGQGTLIASRILGGIATTAGLDVKVSEVHGMAQRGGSVVTFVRYGDEVFEPIVEEGCADVLIAFERLEAKRYAHFLKPDGVLIVNDVRIDPMPVRIGAAPYPENIIEEIAETHRGRSRRSSAIRAASTSSFSEWLPAIWIMRSRTGIRSLSARSSRRRSRLIRRLSMQGMRSEKPDGKFVRT